ncbi:cytochrome P450 2U1-like [Asterias rubens]|uniref:cytochrome P450 2U1-like n=1 Tax=Asterias rubens TaxID=7604 RepID=UPI0014553C7A|nr:cytochrome P450 2U1-like [Asterias rubens]
MSFLVSSLLDIQTALLGVFVLLVLVWLTRKPRNLPPGPLRVPIIGSVMAVVWEALRRGTEPYRIFAKLAEKYGTVFHVKIFNKTVVVLNDYASVREAFVNPKLSDRPKLLLNDFLKSEGVATASGERWVELRRFCLTVLRSFGVGRSSFEDQIGTEAKALMDEMVKFDGKPFNPKTLLSNAVSNVVCAVVLGQRYEYSDRRFTELLSLLSRNVQLLGPAGFLKMTFYSPHFRHVPFSGLGEIENNFGKLTQFLKNIIDNHRENFDADNVKDLTDAYLLEIQGSPEERVTDGVNKSTKHWHLNECNMIGTIVNLFAAGTETTATTLQWSILYMMAYPDIQKRVHAEIDATVGRNRLPRLADKPGLNFTYAVVLEVQRLASIAAIGPPHCASEDTKISGFNIPKDAILIPNLWNIFRDPSVWPEPLEFKPERFLNAEGKAVKPEELIPFSTGRRSCIGEHLAKMEIFVFFCYFMHRFEFKKPDNSPPLNLKAKPGLTHSPVPFDTRAIKRD